MSRRGRDRRLLHAANVDSGEPYGEKNLLIYTENFGNAAWTKSNCTIGHGLGIKLPAGAGPTGESDELIEVAAAANHTVQQSAVAYVPQQLAFSLYAKAGTRPKLLYGMNDDLGNEVDVLVDLSTGATSVPYSQGLSDVLTGASDAGGGFWRVWVSATMPPGGVTLNVFVLPALSDGSTNYLGVPVVTALLLSGAQLEKGAAMTSYSPRLAA